MLVIQEVVLEAREKTLEAAGQACQAGVGIGVVEEKSDGGHFDEDADEEANDDLSDMESDYSCSILMTPTLSEDGGEGWLRMMMSKMISFDSRRRSYNLPSAVMQASNEYGIL
jgi:pyruvoyl-dependent arginine decarboxylase (PvlArgDC)